MNIYDSYRIRKHVVQVGEYPEKYGRTYFFSISSHDSYLCYHEYDTLVNQYESEDFLWGLWYSLKFDEEASGSRGSGICYS